MTDADVDGAHIRTLLLTFFYRNMPQLIGDGNLFIAQPPLYKGSKGKSSQWLYSETEKDAWLAEKIYGKIKIVSSNSSDKKIEKGELGIFSSNVKDYVDSLMGLESLEIPSGVIEKLITNPDYSNLEFTSIKETNSTPDKPQASFDDLLDENDNDEINSAPTIEEDSIEVTHNIDGYELTKNIYEHPTVNRLRKIYKNIGEFLKEENFDVYKGADLISSKISWKEIPEILENNAENSGVSIQRYKGLGEMNADQLWETTMDPENRVLLQVTSDDATAADDLFRKLMGDDVEPRRRFIQTNALEAKNIDIA
tara:strand:- start:48 stop:977 length:930 start_codon:yes stop_codon:yes gene_type:complete